MEAEQPGTPLTTPNQSPPEDLLPNAEKIPEEVPPSSIPQQQRAAFGSSSSQQARDLINDILGIGNSAHIHLTLNYGTQYTVGGDVSGSAFGEQATYNAGAATGGDISPDTSPSPRSVDAPDFSTPHGVEDWFFDQEGDNALERQLHLLMVGIFAGNSARFVRHIRQFFVEEMQVVDEVKEEEAKDKSEKPRKKSGGNSPFQRRSRDIMQMTGTITRDYIYQEGGVQRQMQVIGFVDPQAQRCVLDFLRMSPDLAEFRDKLEQFLFRLCHVDDTELTKWGTGLTVVTRSQAALALGELARYDYTYYYERYIKPLVYLGLANPVFYTTVGWMLYQLARSKDYTDIVFQQLQTWAGGHNRNPHSLSEQEGFQKEIVERQEKLQRLNESHDTQSGLVTEDDDFSVLLERWAAASAIGTVGFVDIDRSMQIVDQLLRNRDDPIPELIHLATLSSVKSLYALASGAPRILYHFALWLRLPQDTEANKQRTELGLLFFLALIDGRISNDALSIEGKSKVAKSGSLATAQTFSTLTIWGVVHQAHQIAPHTTIEADLIDLIKACLSHRRASVVNKICDVMETWIEQGDEYEDLRQTIVSVLQQIHQDRHGQRHICRIITSKKFAHSPTAYNLRRICDC